MSSSDPSKTVSPQSTTNTVRTAIWRKPLVWVGALMLAALGASLTDAVQDTITGVLESVSPGEFGDPLAVHIDRDAVRKDIAVSLPPGTSISTQEAAAVEPSNVRLQADWLEDRGGVVIGQRSLTVTITGKRSSPVRVTDIRDASECTSPQRGTLVRFGDFRSHIDPAVRVGIFIGSPDEHAFSEDPMTGARQPYFPHTTILLNKGEQHVLVIDLRLPEAKVCRPQLEMTVMDGDKELKQNIVPEHQRTPIMQDDPAAVEGEYRQLFLWGRICQNLVSAVPGWENNESDPCGVGG